MRTPYTRGNASLGWMPTSDGGVVNILMRSSRIASAPRDGVLGVGADGLQPTPKSDARNPRIAINLMRVRSGLTIRLTDPAPVVPDMPLRRNRGVHCIRLVGPCRHLNFATSSSNAT
jgi:hypothetical protein